LKLLDAHWGQHPPPSKKRVKHVSNVHFSSSFEHIGLLPQENKSLFDINNQQSHFEMSGKGKGPIAPSAAVRHRRRRQLDPLLGIKKGGLVRLARRGGAKRVSADTHPEMRAILDKFLDGILHGANLYASSRGSGNQPTKTIKVSDVLYALNHAGLPAVGF
jgi:histone H3/H4